MSPTKLLLYPVQLGRQIDKELLLIQSSPQTIVLGDVTVQMFAGARQSDGCVISAEKSYSPNNLGKIPQVIHYAVMQQREKEKQGSMLNWRSLKQGNLYMHNA